MLCTSLSLTFVLNYPYRLQIHAHYIMYMVSTHYAIFQRDCNGTLVITLEAPYYLLVKIVLCLANAWYGDETI